LFFSSRCLTRYFFRDKATGELFVNARGEPIGEGAFGVIYEVWDKEGNKAALKVPKPAANMRMVRSYFCG
jgi:RIO-like serine/threonine protein kinase